MTAPEHIPAGAQLPADTSPKRSLILAGGGMRVAYQAGVIRALFEAGLTFAHADGTSGGTINLAMLFSGLSAVEMCDRWRIPGCPRLRLLAAAGPIPQGH